MIPADMAVATGLARLRAAAELPIGPGEMLGPGRAGRAVVPDRSARASRACGRPRRGHGVDGLGQREDLTGDPEQLLVLMLLSLDLPPLVVGQYLTFLIRPVLADHHERRQENGLK